MFIGHWAPALAAAAASKKSPGLGTLFVAAQLVDWAFFSLAWAGVEHLRIVPGFTAMNPMDLYHMPYTHSLLGSAVWAAAFAGLLWLVLKDRSAALIGGGVVLSHWFLDLLVHAPDLTLAGSPPPLGLGLWNHPMIEIPLELAITFGALAWYAKARPGPLLPVLMIGGVLLLVQTINWFGPPPTEAGPEMYGTALFAYALVTAIAWWVGRTRAALPAQG